MLRPILLAGVPLAVLAYVQQPAPLNSAEVAHVNGIEAVAFLGTRSGQDPEAQIVIAVTEGYRQEPPGRGLRSTIAFVDITFPECEGDGLLCDGPRRITAFGLVAPHSFVVDQRLSGAELNIHLEGRAVPSGESVDVFVSLTWKGYGGFQRSLQHVSSDEGGERFVTTGFHFTRQAVVSGSVGDWAVAGTGTLTRLGRVSVVPKN